MTKEEYIKRIYASRNEKGWATRATLDLIEAALREYPHAPDLWCLRGNMIQLGDESWDDYALDAAQDSYRRALEESPDYAEAYESLGWFFDAVEDNPSEAEPFFRRALEMEAVPGAFAGLARVLAELGRKPEAISLLSPKNCPYADDSDVKEMLTEIEEGMWDSD